MPQTGGIVPEVAARQQLRWIVPTVRAALDEAGVRLGRTWTRWR